MAKLHELIASEPNVTAVFNSMREETLKVFGKPDNFTKTVTTKSYFDEENRKLDTVETKDMVTTVQERLRYFLSKSFTRYVDLQLRKDKTNQHARADLVVAGKTLAKDVPATMLLQLEKELAHIRSVLLQAPTLQSGPVWVRDESEGLFVTLEPQVSFSTKKSMRPVILVEATKEHPAQVEKVTEDVPVAKVERKVWSGMITSREKADMIGRVDALLVAAKRARQRANSQEADKSSIGSSIVDYILSGSGDGFTDEDAGE